MGTRAREQNLRRERLVALGIRRCLEHPMDALRALVNASALHEATKEPQVGGEIPKASVYRLFAEEGTDASDALLKAVITQASSPSWSGYERSWTQVAEAFAKAVAEGKEPADQVKDALAANVRGQLSSSGHPIGWLFQMAATRASSTWEDDGYERLDPKDTELAEDILRVRRDFYETMTDHLEFFLSPIMATLQVRPRKGIGSRQILTLVHALMDGAVLRLLIEPDALSPELVAEAMFNLGMSFSEPGGFSDPRRPVDPDDRDEFDRMIGEAKATWLTGTAVTLEGVAQRTGLASTSVIRHFSSVPHLADSVVWDVVLGHGPMWPPPLANRGQWPRSPDEIEIQLVPMALWNLHEAAQRYGDMVAMLRSDPNGQFSALPELGRQISEMIPDRVQEPDITANTLVKLAAEGDDTSWTRVVELLHIIGIAASTVPSS